MYTLANQRAANAAQIRFDNANPYDLSTRKERAETLKEAVFLKKQAQLNEKLEPQDLMDVLLVLSDDDLQHIANFLQRAGKARTLIEKGIDFLAHEAGEIAAKNYLSIGERNLAKEVYFDLMTKH